MHNPYINSSMILEEIDASQFEWRIEAVHYPERETRTLELMGFSIQMPESLWPQFEAALRKALDGPREYGRDARAGDEQVEEAVLQ